MAMIAPLVDGKFDTENASSASLKNAKEAKNSSGVDSEAFLTLLVAEMKNQDPLEPTSNTEWVSQYATFTQVSEIQSIGDAMNSVQAQGLATGETDYVDGMVERVGYEEGKAHLYIDGTPYSIDDLDTVISEEYMAATEKADDVKLRMKSLPSVTQITEDHVNSIVELGQVINSMSDYEKNFLEEGTIDAVNEYVDRATAIVKEQQAAKEKEAAKTAAKSVDDTLKSLPDVEEISLSNEETIMTLHNTVEAMSTYQKGFVGQDNLDKVENYYYRLKDLKNA